MKKSSRRPSCLTVTGAGIGARLAAKYAHVYKDRGGFPIMVSPPRSLEVLPTGLACLDVLLAIGGWPRQRYVMLHGKPESGKTTLALLACAAAQRAGGVAFYIDREGKLDGYWARTLGVDVENLVLLYPPSIEAGFDAVEDGIRMCESGYGIPPEKEGDKPIKVAPTKGPFVVVDDSIQRGVAAIRLRGERKYDDKEFAWEAKAYATCYRRFGVFMARHDVTYFAIDQVRMQIGDFIAKEGYGVGNETRHASALTLDFTWNASSQIKAEKGTGYIGKRVRVRIEKNQISPARGSVSFTDLYGTGPNAAAALHDAALHLGIAQPAKKGAKDFWKVILPDGSVVKWTGWEGMMALAEKHPERWAAVEALIREAARTRVVVAVSEDPDLLVSEPDEFLPVAGDEAEEDDDGEVEVEVEVPVE